MSFARALGFAALAAAGVPLFVSALGPLLGHAFAVRLYLVGSAVAYAAALAPGPRRALLAATLAGGLGALLLLLPLRLPGLAVGVAATIAVVRSRTLYQSPGWRGAALEVCLQGAGLLLAAWLVDSGLVSLALAVWGYYLVQSLHLLVGGVGLRRPEPQGDPFDQARSRLHALLD